MNDQKWELLIHYVRLWFTHGIFLFIPTCHPIGIFHIWSRAMGKSRRKKPFTSFFFTFIVFALPITEHQFKNLMLFVHGQQKIPPFSLSFSLSSRHILLAGSIFFEEHRKRIMIFLDYCVLLSRKGDRESWPNPREFYLSSV